MKFIRPYVGLLVGAVWAQNVGIGTSTPQQRLHVMGKGIFHDGQAGTPQVGTWGSAGSRLILWPGTAAAHPYEIGINTSTFWYSVPQGAQYVFYHGGNEVFAITPTTRGLVNVGGNTNFPSIWIGNAQRAISSGPYPKRGTFLFFGGPTNGFEDNTDPALMYFVHLASDVTRLRLHVEDNGSGASDGFSIMGASCGGGCQDLNNSQLLFDFVSDGQAYKPGGGNWASISDIRTKSAITPYTKGLSELRQLNPVRYRYREKYFPAFKDRWYTGLIAQEVQRVVPEMVHPYLLQISGDKLEEVLAVDPSDLTYMLINAVKELDSRTKQLEEKVAALEREKQQLEARLSALEKHQP
ncbi:MAG: tail fiber domain-containing protein [Bacteroidia bacterium]|nr:tail fiber domain-containing protein [Bacteroidia bacterium]